jgi:hypothetical protein
MLADIIISKFKEGFNICLMLIYVVLSMKYIDDWLLVQIFLFNVL